MDSSRLNLRYWDADEKKMYYVAKLDLWGDIDQAKADLCDKTGDIQLFDVEIDIENLMQCTGFKDKNGRYIYEGDILIFEDLIYTENGYSVQQCSGIVEWNKDTASFDVTDRILAESYEIMDGECIIKEFVSLEVM